MEEVYVCPSFICNLDCPHCTLKNLPITSNWEGIFNTLECITDNAGNNVLFDLFGGEPLIIERVDFSS